MTRSTGSSGGWSRLERLVKSLSGGGRARRPEELREFWRLYRAATSRLAALQADGRVCEEEYYLNRLVAAAHAILYRRRPERSAGRRFLGFLSHGWPSLVRRHADLVGLAFAIFLAGGALGVFYGARDPGFVALVASPELLASIEDGEMWTSGILSVAPAASSLIFSNNLSVAIFAFATGITAGLGTAWILLLNGVSFGGISWLVGDRGMAADFWGFVAAHGVLELPAIFIAGGAGLLLGRGILFPGRRTRRRSIREAAGDAALLLAGCGPVLLVAAGIESWFSPRPDPLALKLAVAAVIGAGFLAYLRRGAQRI